MLILGKNYYVSEDYVVVKPVAKIHDKELIFIDRETRYEVFPNSGKIHTPLYHQKITVGNFMIYELEPSNTYERANQSSHYYTVKQMKTNISLFEVLYLEESYEENQAIIIEIIKNGISSKVEPLKDIILKTSDNYLIGPFKTEHVPEDNKIVIKNDFEINKYIIPVYADFSSQFKVSSYYDSFDEVERYFTLTVPDNELKKTDLDIADDDYVVRESIRLLKGQQEFGDITRKVSQGINEWLKNVSFSEELNYRRLKKTVELLKEIDPAEEGKVYQNYTDELLSLPLVSSIIQKQIEDRLKLEKKEFIDKNKNLAKQNEKLQTEFTDLIINIDKEKEELVDIQQDVEKYKEFMLNKRNVIEEDIYELYFQQLLQKNLATGSSKHEHFIIKNDVYSEVDEYATIEELKKIFKDNLRQYGERDIQNVFFDYCMSALKLNQPLIIVGQSAFRLAEVIQKTFSATYNQTIVPEPNHFSLDVLNEIRCGKDTAFNITAIHNIHIAQASLNLSGFFNLYASQETDNKMIFTFDSLSESQFLLEQLNTYSVLNIGNKAFLPSPFELEVALELGQLDYHMLKNRILPKMDFEDSLEDVLMILEEKSMSNHDNIDMYIKNKFKRIIYINQFVGKAEKSLSYFPFLEQALAEDLNE